MNGTRIQILLLTLIASVSVQAQETMKLEDALIIALSQNRNILISKAESEIPENLAHPGQAGLLPVVNASGGITYGNNDTEIQIANSPEIITTTGAASTQYNAGINLNYTLFAGFANQNTYRKLQITADLADAGSRVEVENILLQVASAFYNVLRAEENVSALTEAMNISGQRFDRAKASEEYGGGNTLATLSAEVDYNRDQINLMNAELALDQARVMFNQVLGQDPETPVSLNPDVAFTELESLESFRSRMEAQNAQLLTVRYSQQASLMDYKIAQSAYYPRIDASAGYAYSRSENEGSFLVMNQNLGYNAGITLSIPIFNANRRKVSVENAGIQQQVADMTLEETRQLLTSNLVIAHQDYQNALAQLEMEEVNLRTAEKNFEMTKERFAQGQVTNIDFRTAQLNLLFARNSLNNTRYNAKLAELELLRLGGMLIQQ